MAGGIRLRVLPAYHDDLLARDQAVGLALTVPAGGADGAQRQILFTSDTGLYPLEKDGKDLKPNTQSEKEIWKGYRLKEGNRPDLMVIHIGSVKDAEFKMAIEKDPKEICYPNHLGIIGCARVITECRPRLAVISEFGEEMRQFRCELVEGLQNNVVKPVLEKRGETDIPRVVPGDLPFIYDIHDDSVYCVMSGELVKSAEIAFAREGGGDDLRRSVYYFAEGKKAEFGLSSGKQKIRRFQHNREDWQNLYFVPKT